MNVASLEDREHLFREPLHIFQASLSKVQKGEIFNRNHGGVIADPLSDESFSCLEKEALR